MNELFANKIKRTDQIIDSLLKTEDNIEALLAILKALWRQLDAFVPFEHVNYSIG